MFTFNDLEIEIQDFSQQDKDELFAGIKVLTRVMLITGKLTLTTSNFLSLSSLREEKQLESRKSLQISWVHV